MSELMEMKTPEQLGAEIRLYVDAGRRISLLCGIEIGKRLVQAKEMLDHGEWMPWLERETEFSSSSAQRYMKLYEEYGASQQGLFGPETNSPTLGNLPISKAFALLSVPESDREAFAEEVDAEHISVRELEEKIKELRAWIDNERKRGDEAIREKLEAEELLKTHEELLKSQDANLASAKAQIDELTKINKELKNKPVEVAVETVRDEQAIRDAAKEAKEKAEKAAKKKIEDLEKQLNKAENERAEAVRKAEAADQGAAKKAEAAEKEAEKLRTQLEEARKQLKASDSDITAFGIRFNTLQNEFGYMIAEYRKVAARDPETADKLHEAVRQLIEYFQKELDRKEDTANV